MKPSISVIICTQDGALFLKKHALPSLKKSLYKNFEVVIVDDGSSDSTKEVSQSYEKHLPIKYIKISKSKGLCHARNVGTKHASGTIVAFIDNDTYVEKKWTQSIYQEFLKDKKLVGIGGKTYVGLSKKIFNPNKQIFGCNMAFKKSIFERFQFDTNLYFDKSSLYDETEFIWRIKRKGLKTKYCPKMIVQHFVTKDFSTKYMRVGDSLNFLYFAAKKISLLQYYYDVLRYLLLLQKFEQRSLKRSELDKIKDKNPAFYGIKELNYYGRLKKISIRKTPWILSTVLIQIPIKSRLT